MNSYDEIKKIDNEIDKLTRQIYFQLHNGNLYDTLEWRESLSYYRYKIKHIQTNYNTDVHIKKEVCLEKIRGLKRTLRLVCKIR